MKAFWVALQFLTRLPTPRLVSTSPEERGRSVPFYPLVGLIIGTLIAGLQYLLAAADTGLQSALVLLAWVLFTGGLHLDGLADSADAWAGSHGDRGKALRIMKDAASGPAGVAAVTLVLLVKLAALSALIRQNAWPTLILAPVLGRMAIVFLFLTTPYVRSEGLGAAQSSLLPRSLAVIVLVLFVVFIIVSGWAAIIGMLAAAGMLLMLRAMMMRRLGGMTGDTLGAACELIETAVVVAAALAWK